MQKYQENHFKHAHHPFPSSETQMRKKEVTIFSDLKKKVMLHTWQGLAEDSGCRASM